MDVYEIQTVVLECLKAAKVPRVYRTTIYSMSDNPAEVGVARKAKKNSVYAEFLATFDEFMDFRERAKAKGVWVTPTGWTEQKGSDQLHYKTFAVEMDARRK